MIRLWARNQHSIKKKWQGGWFLFRRISAIFLPSEFLHFIYSSRHSIQTHPFLPSSFSPFLINSLECHICLYTDVIIFQDMKPKPCHALCISKVTASISVDFTLLNITFFRLFLTQILMECFSFVFDRVPYLALARTLELIENESAR